jgi:hypothetical protein
VNTAFRQSFEADLAVIKDAALLHRIKRVIEQVEAARTFRKFPTSNGWKRTASITAFVWVTTVSVSSLKQAL